MSLWNKVVVGFDVSDETLNFGTRAVAVTGQGIYESNTLATIHAENESELNSEPLCKAKFHLKAGIAISCDKSFVLFDHSLSNVVVNFSHDDIIEEFEISEDGQLIFFGLKNGNLVCIHLPSLGKVLFSKNLMENINFEGSHFFSQIVTKCSDQFLVFLNCGSLVSVTGLDVYLNLVELKDEEIQEYCESLSFNYTQFCNHEVNCAVSRFVYYHGENTLFTFDHCLASWSENNRRKNLVNFKNELKIKKMDIPSTENFIICLSEEGYLVLICMFTFEVILQWDSEPVSDFTCIETVIHGENTLSILAVIAGGRSNGQVSGGASPQLCLLQLPDLKKIWSFEVSASSYLLHGLSTCEDIMFIEALGNEKINTLFMKQVLESHPDFRLERLLQKGKFEKAEKFAQDLGLSLETVYKGKARWLMSKLQLWNKSGPELVTKHFEELSDLLEKIQDVEFVTECCLKTIAPDLSMVRRFLDYASKRLKQSNLKDATSWMEKINKTRLDLCTFLEISDPETANADNWLIFSTSNPIMICLRYISRGDIKEASIVCKRQEARIRRELPRELAVRMFDDIPYSVSLSLILDWLSVYHPLLMKTHPDLLPDLVTWIEERVKHLEMQEPEAWAENSLQFLTRLTALMFKESSLTIPPLDAVPSLIRHVHSIHVLRSNFGVNISLTDYTSAIDTIGFAEVVSMILDKVSRDRIPSVVSKYLSQFCIDHGLDIDAILSAYVVNFVRRQSSYFWGGESKWELRAETLINCISSLQEKMKAVEITMSRVGVPWIPEVAAMAETAMKMDHPVAKTIYRYSLEVPLRIIGKKYGLPEGFDTTDVHCLIKHIYLQERDTMIEDAKQVVKCTEDRNLLLPYHYYVLHTIEKGEMEKSLVLISSELNKEQSIQTVRKAVAYITGYLNNKFIREKKKYQDALPILQAMLLSLDTQEALETEIDTRKCLAPLTLKEEYNLDVSSSTLYYPFDKRTNILNTYVNELDLSNSVAPIQELASQIGRLATLLDLPSCFGLLILAVREAALGKSKEAAHLISLFLKTSGSFFKFHSTKIIEPTASLLRMNPEANESIEEVAALVCEILKKVAVHCSHRDLSVVMGLLSVASLYYVPKPVSLNRTLYTDPTETSVAKLPADISNRILNCVLQIKHDYEEGLESLNLEQLEKAIQLMPHNFSSINRIQTITWILSVAESFRESKKMRALVKEKVSNVLVRVMFSRNSDVDLALSLLSLFQPELGLQWLLNVISKTKVTSFFALVAQQYCSLTKEHHYAETFRNLYVKNEWSKKLKRFGIPPKALDSCGDTYEGKKKLLLKLMSAPGVHLNLLTEFCEDMSFSIQDCLRIYLEHTLITWEPSNHRTETSGERKLVNEEGGLSLKCFQIQVLIENSEELIDYLKNNVWNRVNFYYYEVFLVIAEIIVELSPRHKEVLSHHRILLSFLLSYHRISPISTEESDNWFHFFPDTSSLPPISKHRLPFAPLPADPWKIIKPELTMSTYKLWMNAPMWFNVTLDKDCICSFTIMNLRGEVVGKDEWNLHHRFKPLMADIAECISYIPNIETAVAASYCVVNYVIPPGADRVEAAQRCYLKAREWVDQTNSESAKIGLIKAEKKYFTVSVYHTLHKHRLAKPEYLDLALQPANLITALYHDPTIISRQHDFTSHAPEINQAVERIAALHSFDVDQLISELLCDWLQPENCMNSSFNDSLGSSSSSSNIIRACYVLSGNRKFEEELIGLVFSPLKEGRVHQSSGLRHRALLVLLRVSGELRLAALVGSTPSSIREHISNLEFSSELEKFGLDLTPTAFETAAKESIVEGLLSHSSAPSLALAAKICTRYSITECRLWNPLLKKLVSFNMVSDLETILPELSSMASVLNEENLLSAWNFLILSLLYRGHEAAAGIEKSFILLQACPLMHDLDLDKMAHLYVELGRADLAEFLRRSIPC